jgi:hypothetical protein
MPTFPAGKNCIHFSLKFERALRIAGSSRLDLVCRGPGLSSNSRRAPGRHTDQTEAKAEVLTCNNPCRSVTRGDLILIHHHKPELPRHHPWPAYAAPAQSPRQRTEWEVPTTAHTHGRSHTTNRTTPPAPLPLRSPEWSRKSSYKSPQNTMPGTRPVNPRFALRG